MRLHEKAKIPFLNKVAARVLEISRRSLECAQLVGHEYKYEQLPAKTVARIAQYYRSDIIEAKKILNKHNKSTEYCEEY